MAADRVMIVLLIISCLLVAGCVDSLQAARTRVQNESGPETVPSPGVSDGGLLQVPGNSSPATRQAPGERMLPSTPDTRQAHEPLVGRYGDLSWAGNTQQDPGSTETITGSSPGSSGSPSLPASAADTGLIAPMPASGLGSLSEPGQNLAPVPAAGGAGNPPGEYYEGAGAVITPFATRDPNSCGCAM
jgi:hypothetical protein